MSKPRRNNMKEHWKWCLTCLYLREHFNHSAVYI